MIFSSYCLRSMIAAVALIVMPFAAFPATAQDWPNRAVTLVVPFGPGSASDVVGRIFAARLSEVLGQQVVIENMGGAGGTTGVGRVSKAAPDGYQFVMGGIDTFAMSKALYKRLPYDPVADFTPVALVAEQPIVLLVRKDLPANDLKEFIAYGKANPGKMQYGSAGVGSASHLGCAQLNAAAGIDAVHVPYRGSAPAVQDAIAGRIDYICALGAAALPQIEGETSEAAGGADVAAFATAAADRHRERTGPYEFRCAVLERFFRAEGDAAGGDRQASARDCCHDRDAGPGRAAEKVRLDFRCRQPPLVGIFEGFSRQRDRQMGRDHQGERSESGLMTRCRNPIRLSNSQARITTCSAQQARSHA